MKNIFHFKKPIRVEADVVNNHLILSLPHALSPVVWRMSLDKIGTASFEIKEDKKKNAFALVIKYDNKKTETIAALPSQQDALDSLIAASAAMQAGEANDRKSTKKSSPIKQDIEPQKWVVALLAVIIIGGLYFYLTTLMPSEMDPAADIDRSAQSSSTTGVPLSADEFLQGR